MFYHADRRNHPRQRRNGPVCCCMTLSAASAFHSVAARGWWEWVHSALFVPDDHDIQSHASEGPNTSSLWIWRKSIQWLLRCFIYKQKKSHSAPRTEPLCSSLHAVKIAFQNVGTLNAWRPCLVWMLWMLLNLALSNDDLKKWHTSWQGSQCNKPLNVS